MWYTNSVNLPLGTCKFEDSFLFNLKEKLFSIRFNAGSKCSEFNFKVETKIVFLADKKMFLLEINDVLLNATLKCFFYCRILFVCNQRVNIFCFTFYNLDISATSIHSLCIKIRWFNCLPKIAFFYWIHRRSLWTLEVIRKLFKGRKPTYHPKPIWRMWLLLYLLFNHFWKGNGIEYHSPST